jgi:hypothetical protein
VVERLRSSYRSVRERAGSLAQLIAADLPDFTVHDERHLVAVCELADLLRGHLRLNPLEGYVFGVAILLHDLAMGVAAYPLGFDEIRADFRWRDALALSGAADEPAGSETRLAAERNATAAVLRTRHAEHAQELASVCWDGPTARNT